MKIENYLSKKWLASVLILLGWLAASSAISQNIKLNPIKPASNRTLTDEQQGILAVRKAKASVVNIVGDRKTTGRGDSTEIVEQVSGTGFIYNSEGLIVSNSHVVEDETAEYSVIFPDGTEYPAKILGLDKYNDVGLLKIEAKNLSAAALGNSDILETGQSVFAIGNSLGRYQNTVTKGVVSGLGRLLGLGTPDNPKTRYQNLIQTDAAINPGNSGGPLINMLGEVVGINTAIDRTGESVGFAVPINSVKSSVSQLLSLGKVSHPYAGLVFATINKTLKAEKNLTADQGALVLSVTADGPSYYAGVRNGDVILEINREKLNEHSELDAVVQKYRAGDTVLVRLLRGAEIIETPLLLGEYK